MQCILVDSVEIPKVPNDHLPKSRSIAITQANYKYAHLWNKKFEMGREKERVHCAIETCFQRDKSIVSNNVNKNI